MSALSFEVSFSTAAILGIHAQARRASTGIGIDPQDPVEWVLVSGKGKEAGSMTATIAVAGTQLSVVVPFAGETGRGKSRPAILDDAFLPAVVRHGLPFACAENLAAVLELPMSGLYDLIDVAPATAHRRKKDQVLSRAESDRLARVARITAEAFRVFGDPGIAKRWLGRTHVVLGGMTPLEMLDTDSGAEQVADELVRIESGDLVA